MSTDDGGEVANMAAIPGGHHAPEVQRQERHSDVFYCAYPSFVVGFCPDFALYMCIRPLTPGSVAIRWGVTGVADNPNSPEVERYIKFCKELCAEDRTQLEPLRRGLASLSYVLGPQAPDHAGGTVWDIIQYMARRPGAPDPLAPLTSIETRAT